jgi:hypothetical protein
MNCTSIDSGRCENSGKCKCTEGSSGDACEFGLHGLLPIDTSCPNECSHHGNCNTETGICICEVILNIINQQFHKIFLLN